MIPLKSKSREGFTLILVLAFILLVVIVTLAFFSNAILQRQISNSSANQAKVNLFAQGALATTLGDLKQEIVAGSTAIPVAGGSTIYWPTSPASMVPYRAGTASTLPNLVKSSALGQPFYPNSAPYTAAGPSRASSLSTSASTSHPISTVRWNAPLLLPKATPNQNADLTPITDFTAPNWIYVDESGSNPTAVPSSGSPATVGRYAYCIYDEGGLVDMNVAGYPAEMDATHASHKIGSSFADLTQLAPSGETGLTTAQIDDLVGWRNYASTQPTGTFPTSSSPTGYQFTTTSGLNYFNSVFSNPWGFMTVNSGMSVTANPTTLYSGQSDQKFAGRQQLINFLLQTLGASSSVNSDVLQYMGTFSRSLDQPSFRPDPNRPKVAGNASSAVSGNYYVAPDAGGNDAYGVDDQVNPFFLSVPVTASFTRNDGTSAIVGEPLVKKRFALNRLCWITYKGPIALLSSTDPIVTGYLAQGIPQQLINQGTAANILNYFGLTWNVAATGSYWSYNHGIAANNIGRLSDLQGLREPDFFELLKASLTVGSLGKSSGSGGSGIPSGFIFAQYVLDTTTARQILQIGANMIDQFDADSYPTHIQYKTSPPAGDVYTEIYGSENIPGLYRVRGIGVNVNTAGRAAMLLLPEVWDPYDPGVPATVAGPTNFRFLIAGSPASVEAISESTTTEITMSGITIKAEADAETFGPPGTPQVTLDPPTATNTPYMPTTNGVTELDFTVPAGSFAYHQPIFIGGRENGAQLSAPGLNMHAGAGNNVFTNPDTMSDIIPDVPVPKGYVKEALKTGANYYAYCGVLLGTFATIWSEKQTLQSETEMVSYPLPRASPAQYPKPSWFQGYYSIKNASTADECDLAASSPVEYILQYQGPAGTWITYQDNTGPLPHYGNTSTLLFTSQNQARWIDITQPAKTTGTNLPIIEIESGMWLTWLDPRTSRFGSPANEYVRAPQTVTGQGYYSVSNRPSTDWGSGCTQYIPGTGCAGPGLDTPDTEAPGLGWYPGGWFWQGNVDFVPGFYADNITNTRVPPDTSLTGGPSYFCDPDGVVRRGMGGFAGPTASNKSPYTTPSTATVNTTGLPLATPASFNSTFGTWAVSATATSRPYILNRPFRSVAELGYVFSGTPWRNLDFSTPESGCTALLDTFCVNETPDSGALVAGKVNLNTRQAPVLQALLSGSGTGGLGAAYKDETNPGVAGGNNELSPAEVQLIAQTLVNRTTSTMAGQGPLENVADLVGKWNATVSSNGGTAPFNIDGSQSYVGFGSDLVNNTNSLDQVFASTDASPFSTTYIQRMRESAIRALSAGGQTRVWNLMIDVVAQTGKFPKGASSLDNFLVDGERRYWLHVAIDRFTGKVLDEQLEQVNE